jgi:ABC-2 type transport system ATP-binding protein
MRRRVLIGSAVAVVVLVVAVVALALGHSSSPTIRQQVLSVPVGPGANGKPVVLDATLFLPESDKPAPAVVLAHGFGGSKTDETPDALYLARHGYVVLTYSARGFGHSTGQISLDSPQYEVADASKLIDLLAKRPEVLLDGPNDPRVGFAGASYGGALSLLVAGYDKRVDAIVPSITWNNLGQALFPQMAEKAGPPTTPASVDPLGAGVFKRTWAGLFFSSGSTGGLDDSTSTQSAPSGEIDATASTCGRFTPAICAAYQTAAAGGTPSPEILALLQNSSPDTILKDIHAPTLLIQGEADSLFPLSEADANAKGIAAAGTPVKEVWYAGGHDGGVPETSKLRKLTLDWFNQYLGKPGSAATKTVEPATSRNLRFEFSRTTTFIASGQAAPTADTRIADAAGLPGLAGNPPVTTSRLTVRGPEQEIVAPAGGSPAELTGLPGLSDLFSQLGALGAGSVLSTEPGQDADFDSARLTSTLHIVGAPTITVTVRSSTTDATLFAKLVAVSASGKTTTLPQNLVSPVRLTNIAPSGQTVQIALPAVVFSVPTGDTLRVVISSTDQGFAMPVDARTYRIALATGSSGAVVIPTVASHEADAGASPVAGIVAVVVVLLLLGIGAVAIRRRRPGAAPARDEDLRGVPLVIEGVSKTYGDGFHAVDSIDFVVTHGEILGLLGPNGAGKTTTLRMVVGLIHPSAGEIRVFGEAIRPGSAVLSRVGAFIEGPGFLPHLSGSENLTLYWRATGRPMDEAELDTALEIAGLGDEVHRKVRTYSHGMKQRLGIAQAMLGLPELLILDEPTNGLDPPQIRQMRDVLVRYAATGRTVVVSSHQLAEVEQTCTHVVVMNRGRVLARGRVADLIGASGTVAFDVDKTDEALALVATLDGVADLVTTSSGLAMTLDGTRRSDVVRALVGAGIRVERVAPQHQLEDVFLTLVETPDAVDSVKGG